MSVTPEEIVTFLLERDGYLSLRDGPAALEGFHFEVVTGNASAPRVDLDVGEILLCDSRDNEVFGEGRRPYKWSVETTACATLAEARELSARLKAGAS